MVFDWTTFFRMCACVSKSVWLERLLVAEMKEGSSSILALYTIGDLV